VENERGRKTDDELDLCGTPDVSHERTPSGLDLHTRLIARLDHTGIRHDSLVNSVRSIVFITAFGSRCVRDTSA